MKIGEHVVHHLEHHVVHQIAAGADGGSRRDRLGAGAVDHQVIGCTVNLFTQTSQSPNYIPAI